ncbi:sporadic carbohydrate cluster 2OG-Fe(II) oxygenase [Polynucleobacter sp. MWH-UH23A]|uniref:sporadic carbohydrate cluster 2OG-Fe(II) oxygenase n=1 Tax=Polynucleobacter sp. MWH-UH23A TaxID=1855613 RepID=UPI003364EBBE
MKSITLGCNKYEVEALESLGYITSVVNEIISKEFPRYSGDISNLHKYVDHEQINSIRLKIFKKINSDSSIYEKLWDIGGAYISEILGPDVLVQTKVNVSIQAPNDESSTLGIHSDCWSGDTPHQINLWIPLTRSYESNAMFLFNFNRTKLIISDLYKNLNNAKYDLSGYIKKEDFLQLEYGEFLIFNPGLLHGNVVNKTESTRMSINVRYKSLFSPDSKPEHISRSAGIFFKLYRTSEWTKLAKSLDEVNEGG